MAMPIPPPPLKAMIPAKSKIKEKMKQRMPMAQQNKPSFKKFGSSNDLIEIFFINLNFSFSVLLSIE